MSLRIAPPPDWLAALHAAADQLPSRPRVALWAGDSRIGSVEPGFFHRAAFPAGLLEETVRGGKPGWVIHGDLTASLHQIALALRDAGLSHVWRDEQLAVVDAQGRRLGTVERAIVRPLGITTHAVHMVGRAPDGRHWVQLRSRDKANDPGLWDTLVGGMVPAADSMQQALERETWEEAGLRFAQLEQVTPGGRVSLRRPTDSGAAGYVEEDIDWWRCILPAGVVPVNQDGEVDEFRLMDGDEVLARLRRDEFTLEAALILTQAGL